MSEPNQNDHWDDLVGLIQAGLCTPFIGAGASAGVLPLGGQLARQWADEYDYPLEDKGDLLRVSQYLAIEKYEMFPKVTLQQAFRNVAPPDFSQPDEPHGALADLNLPIYITTNYDPFMVQALKSRDKDVRREFCRWNSTEQVRNQAMVLDGTYTPTPANPVVYHLHGTLDLLQSMVLTETDYLDFLIHFARDPTLVPPAIRMALSGTALIFVGYSLSDWNFRVILRGLIKGQNASMGFPSLAVQLPKSDLSEQARQRAESYLRKYLSKIQEVDVRIFWGTAHEFACFLRDRVLGAQSCPVEEAQ